jgi:hypothetical protein
MKMIPPENRPEFRNDRKSGFQIGYELGFRLGFWIGQRKMVAFMLSLRFGGHEDAVMRWLLQLDEQQLKSVAERLLDAKSLQELGFPGEPTE